jgi:hypothetical protein
MNREILFTGKSISTGLWVEGSLIIDEKGNCYIGEYLPPKKSVTVNCGRAVGKTLNRFVAIGFVMVDKKTVRQYSGLKDKNGKKVFEGDILKDGNGNVKVVVFMHTRFILKNKDNNRCSSWLYIDKHEIVGNKWDNPELLKGSSRQ